MLSLKKIQVHKAILNKNNHLYKLFHIPIPDEAYNQFIELPNILDVDDSNVSGEGDIWVYILGRVQIITPVQGLQSYVRTQTSIPGIQMVVEILLSP